MNKILVIGAAALISLPAFGQTNDQSTVIAEMQKQIKALQEQVEMLKEGPARDDQTDGIMGKDFFKAKGLTFGFYGESKYRFPKAGRNSFDAHRYVLAPSYQINDWLIFNSELELEHGGVDESTSRSSRFSGELELEQFYVDILLHENFNIRSLGIDLVPVGRINKYHEPTTFYSTERPELYREIIPSTWMEPSIGAFGKITETLDYQLMISVGVEDYTSTNNVPGFTAADGARSARPRLRGGYEENSLAYSGRLHYNGVEGLDASTSFYAAETRGFDNSRTFVGLYDIEALYRVRNTGLELRGDFAYWHMDKPENLLANNDANLLNNVGKQMYGWYLEAAYHIWPEAWREGKGKQMDVVPFIRYSDIVTQSQLPSGNKLDNGTTNKRFLTVGAAWFLNPNVVLKADYRHNLDSSDATELQAANQDYLQLGVGMFF